MSTKTMRKILSYLSIYLDIFINIYFTYIQIHIYILYNEIDVLKNTYNRQTYIRLVLSYKKQLLKQKL